MTNPKRLDQVYADCLNLYPEGYAVYKKVSSRRVKPGACGYFNEDGDWHSIVQTADQDELRARGWTLPKDFQISLDPVITQAWGPKVSRNVSITHSKIFVDSTAQAPGTPLEATRIVKYTTSSAPGAILVTGGEITHKRCRIPKARDWIVQNAKSILKLFPEAREQGIWIVTDVYTAKRRALAVLLSKGSEVTVSIQAGVSDAEWQEPIAGWWPAHGDSTWITHEDNDGIVLFVGGIRWRPRLYSRLSSRLFSKTVTPEKKGKRKSLEAETDHTALGRAGRGVYTELESDLGPIELIPEVIGKDYGLPYSESINDIVDYDDDDSEYDSTDDSLDNLADLKEQCRDLWAQELRYAMPTVLPDVTISIVTFDQLTVKDRMQCWLEDYTGTEWIWHPWDPPRRRASLGKDCIQWTCNCGKVLSACVSKELAQLVLSFRTSTIKFQGGDSAAAPKDSAMFLDSQSRDIGEASPGGSGNSQGGLGKSDQNKAPHRQQAQGLTAPKADERPKIDIRSKFVLFCIDNASKELDAATISLTYSRDSTPICVEGDYEFFNALRTSYISLRGKWRWYLDPLQFSFCHFSRFEKWDIGKLGYLKNEIPSTNEYELSVEPPVEPYYNPISKHEWEQRFYKRVENRYRRSVTNKVPKRATSFELTTHVKNEAMWGLYVQVRPLAWMVFAWQVAILLPGILFMICWLATHHDKPNQWGIAFAPLTASLAIEGSFLALWDKYKLKTE